MKYLLSIIVAFFASLACVHCFTGYTPVFANAARKTIVPNGGSDLMTMRARECDLLGKKPNRQARVVTFSHTRNKKVQEVNLQMKRYFSENLNRNVRLRLSTKGIKTVDKMGGSIDAAAKKFGIDLTKF